MTGGIIGELLRKQPSQLSESGVLTESELFDWMKNIYAPSKKPRFIYIIRLGVSIRKDKTGMCVDGFGGEWRKQLPWETEYIEKFIKELSRVNNIPITTVGRGNVSADAL